MFWWWLTNGSAQAEPPEVSGELVPAATGSETADPDPPELDPQSAPFEEVLRASKQLWFEGRTEVAREWFSLLHGRVLAGEDVAPDDVAEALTWLGEVQYQDGDPDAAHLTFLSLLRRDPSRTISPYHHPTEVVNLFELVRAEVQAERQPPPPAPVPPRPPAPAWVLAPLGVPQLAQGRVGAAVASGGVQLALGATSIAASVHLGRINGKEQPGIPFGSPRELTVQRWRYGVQWPATLLFYGSWAAGSWEAARHFRRSWTIEPAVGFAPRPGGGVVAVSGRF
jgi:hypothetical protein